MKVAIDSSVVIAILKGEPGFESWQDLLIHLASEHHRIVACGIVWAEVSSAYPLEAILRQALRDQRIEFDALDPSTCHLAGRFFHEYQTNCKKKPRKRILADFLVGAHAARQAHGLITNDRGFHRRYFRGLRLYKPRV